MRNCHQCHTTSATKASTVNNSARNATSLSINPNRSASAAVSLWPTVSINLVCAVPILATIRAGSLGCGIKPPLHHEIENLHVVPQCGYRKPALCPWHRLPNCRSTRQCSAPATPQSQLTSALKGQMWRARHYAFHSYRPLR